MSELQALVTGALMGCAMRLSEQGIMVEVLDQIMDPRTGLCDGFRLRGTQSGDVVMVRVFPDAPMP